MYDQRVAIRSPTREKTYLTKEWKTWDGPTMKQILLYITAKEAL